jgi:hypothetical protein
MFAKQEQAPISCVLNRTGPSIDFFPQSPISTTYLGTYYGIQIQISESSEINNHSHMNNCGSRISTPQARLYWSELGYSVLRPEADDHYVVKRTRLVAQAILNIVKKSFTDPDILR